MAEPTETCNATYFFEQILRDSGTVADLRLMFADCMRDNPGKSRAEVMAIYEREKRLYVAELQRQAQQLAQNECWRPSTKGKGAI